MQFFNRSGRCKPQPKWAFLMEQRIMSALDDVQTDYAALKSAIAAETAKLDDLASQIATAASNNDTDALESLASDMQTVTAGINAKLAPATPTPPDAPGRLMADIVIPAPVAQAAMDAIGTAYFPLEKAIIATGNPELIALNTTFHAALGAGETAVVGRSNGGVRPQDGGDNK